MYKAGNRLWHTDSSFKRLPGAVLAAVFAHHRADRRPHRVRRPARGLRRAARGDEARSSKAWSSSIRSPLRAAAAASPSSTRTKRSACRPCRRCWCARFRRPAGKSLYVASHAGRIFGMPEAEGRALHRRADRARHAAAVRLHAPLAPARPRDVGQPLHDAPRHRLRRAALGARHAARDGQRHREHLRTSGGLYTGLAGSSFRPCTGTGQESIFDIQFGKLARPLVLPIQLDPQFPQIPVVERDPGL